MENVRLTNEEKIIKEMYSYVKSNKGKVKKEKIMDCVYEYIDEFLKGTRFEDIKVEITDIKDRSSNGAISEHRNGDMHLQLNFKDALSMKSINNFMNNKNFKGTFELFNTINHELRHLIQMKESQNLLITTNGNTLLKNIENSKDFVAQDYDEYNFYSYGEGNYAKTYIEGDARRSSTQKTAIQFLRIFKNMKKEDINMIFSDISDSIKRDNVEYKKLKYTKDNKTPHNREDVINYYVDEALLHSPEKYINKYPTLALEYNEDGTRKSFEDIIRIRESKIADLMENNKILEETRDNLIEQVNTATAQIMLNRLKTCKKSEIEYLCRKYGNEKVLKELNFIKAGEARKFNERKKQVEIYNNIIEENKDIIPKKTYYDLKRNLKNVFEDAKVTKIIDEENDMDIFLSDDSKYINKVIYYVKDNEFERYKSRVEMNSDREKIIEKYADRNEDIKEATKEKSEIKKTIYGIERKISEKKGEKVIKKLTDLSLKRKEVEKLKEDLKKEKKNLRELIGDGLRKVEKASNKKEEERKGIERDERDR